MLDLLGTVPAQQVEHGRIGARRVETLRVEDPVTQERGDVSDGGNEGEPFDEVVLRPQSRERPPAEQPAEQPPHLVRERGGVETLRLELLEYSLVSVGVHRFLPDESHDVVAQLFVPDERQRLLERLDEPPPPPAAAGAER